MKHFRPSKYLTSFAKEGRKVHRSSCNADVTSYVNNNLHETFALLGPVVKGQAWPLKMGPKKLSRNAGKQLPTYTM